MSGKEAEAKPDRESALCVRSAALAFFFCFLFAWLQASRACFLVCFRVFGSLGRASSCFYLFSCLRGLARAPFLCACGICVFVHTGLVRYRVYVFGCTGVVCLCVWSLGVCVYESCVFERMGCACAFVCAVLGDCQMQPLQCVLIIFGRFATSTLKGFATCRQPCSASNRDLPSEEKI